MISPNTSSFLKNAFDFLAEFKYFLGGRMILVILVDIGMFHNG